MVQTDVLNNTNVLNNCIKMPIPISKANTNLKYTHSSSYWSFLTLSHYRLPWLKNLRTSIVPYPMLFLDSSGMNLPSESCANILLLLQNCRSPTIICLLKAYSSISCRTFHSDWSLSSSWTPILTHLILCLPILLNLNNTHLSSCSASSLEFDPWKLELRPPFRYPTETPLTWCRALA